MGVFLGALIISIACAAFIFAIDAIKNIRCDSKQLSDMLGWIEQHTDVRDYLRTVDERHYRIKHYWECDRIIKKAIADEANSDVNRLSDELYEKVRDV